MALPKGRMNPQPSGMTVPDESFRVDPSHFPRQQEPMSTTSEFVGPPDFPIPQTNIQKQVEDYSALAPMYGNFLKGAGGAVADIGRSFFDPTSWRWGKDERGDPVEYNPAFQPGPTDPMAQRAGYGLIDAMAVGLPTGAPDFESMTDLDAAMQVFDVYDPSGLGGDVAKLGVKAIPEGALAGFAWPSWYMGSKLPPKGVKKKTFNKLEDMWKHKIWTDDRWAPNPKPDEIRDIGARALHMDDLANDVPNTSVDMYMQQGSGAGQTLQMKISQIERGGFGGNPKSLTKESDHFNKLAVDIQSGDDELFGSADYWIESHEDMLQDSYGIDMFDDRMEPIYRTNEEWAKEFNKLSRELAHDAKTAEKRITDNINRIMDEELKIMDRGMKEVTGKGTIGGGSGTLPPQGTGGVLPTKVNDSITNVRKAVDEAIETSTPVEPTVMGMPAREIPSDWRASMPDKPYELDDVKLEVAWGDELETIAGLEKEMANRGVTLTPAIRGQIETARKILQGKSARTNPREKILLYDMIAEANGGRSIYKIEDILSDLSTKELGFNFDDLVVDWDTMGQPERGVEADVLADQIDEEIRKLFYGASPQ